MLSVGLAYFWLWLIVEVAEEVLGLLDQMEASGTAEDRRNLAYVFGVNIAALAGLVAAPLVVIRAWVSERHTKTAEEGLITDRFTKAVEQLGTEKTVMRREFRPRYRVNDDGEWLRDEDGNPVPAARPDGTPLGEWQTLQETVPNLEVRLGAIYALERIAQDSERDHIPIMETLCAYVRENAPASGASDHGLGDWPEDADDEALAERRKLLRERDDELRAWAAGLSAPRVDIQAALTVIGRRSEERVAHERRSGFLLDLRESNLQSANLWQARLERANLVEARLERADLGRARLEGADLGRARLEGARLHSAKLQSADLRDWTCARTSLRSADFTGAKHLTQEHVNVAFGDSATVLPEGIEAPDHWDEEALEWGKKDEKYQAWLDAGAPAGKPRADRA